MRNVVIIKRISSAIKQPKKIIRLSAKQAYVLFRYGPMEYARYFSRAISRHMFIHHFPNGIQTALDVKKAKNWHTLHKKSLVIVVVGKTNRSIDKWMRCVDDTLHLHFIFTEKFQSSTIEPKFYSVLKSDSRTIIDIRQQIVQGFRGNDILVVDLAQGSLPSPEEIIRLQHAAYCYDEHKIGIVQPAVVYDHRLYAGVEFNRAEEKWQFLAETTPDYRQTSIPRYVLSSAIWHCTYIHHDVLEQLSLSRNVLDGQPLRQQLDTLIRETWKINKRTLVFSPVTLGVSHLYKPEISIEQKEWLLHRSVMDTTGKRRVIYVLNATSVSGGIRVVFEHVNGLIERGFAPEIWSLQGQPTWTNVDVTVKKFQSYDDLLLALRDEDAIKVATWWETDQVVWLASVNHGIPVNFIQEFETWFYPDDPIAQAAVVSSYRNEFNSMTTAGYQCNELTKIGVKAPIIPVGYESSIYHPISSVVREKTTVLAIGRSFFQKNFSMTVRAWRRLSNHRPKLLLFGTEPNILRGEENVEYREKPSNEEVNKLYNRATCFVQTSIHEGFSLPIIEAMAAGCPVITTDSHGNRDFCVDGKNCLIVPQNDDLRLSEAITRLLNDRSLQERLRQEGLQTAQRHQWSIILDSVADFYKKITD